MSSKRNNTKGFARTDAKLALEAAPRRQRDEALIGREVTCGQCGWSWCAGRAGFILCGNPQACYFGEIVPIDLGCPEQGTNSAPE
jgi:hypothetical protein